MTGQPLFLPLTLVRAVLPRTAPCLRQCFMLLHERILAESVVAAQRVMRGTNTGSLLGGPPTGRAVALHGADCITIDGGRIRSVRGYFDMKEFGEQLGLGNTPRWSRVMKLKLSIRRDGDITIIDFFGRFEIGEADFFRDTLCQQVKDGARKFVWNLKSLEYCDSFALGHWSASTHPSVPKAGTSSSFDEIWMCCCRLPYFSGTVKTQLYPSGSI